MIWQDLVLMLGGFGFSAALIPAVRAKEKPPLLTSCMTASILTSFALVYLTLGLWLAFIAGSITAGMWWTLFFQKKWRRI